MGRMEIVIQFKSLFDQLYEYLSNSIIEGKIKPGEKLIENDLCRQFGISRSPIRECFRVLESEGLITIVPRKGVLIKELTSQDIEEVFPVRASLESLAVKLAIPNIGQKEIGTLQDLIKKMEEALCNRDIRSFLSLNFSFHTILIKASNNKILEKVLKNLGRGLWLRIAFLYYQSSAEELAISNNMHRQILEAIQKKDALFAQRSIEAHINHGKKQLLISFEKKVSLRYNELFSKDNLMETLL